MKSSTLSFVHIQGILLFFQLCKVESEVEIVEILLNPSRERLIELVGMLL